MNYEDRLENNNLILQDITNMVSNLPNKPVGDVKVFDSIENMNSDSTPITSGLAIVYNINIFDGLYQYNNRYNLANTQLTVTSEDVYKKSFYGNNGVEVGNLQNTENLTLDQFNHRVNIYSELSYLTPNFLRFTNMANMFEGNVNLIIAPNINTNYTQNTSYMFYGCTNLNSVPNYDTFNVTNMSYMFYNCKNLITIFNYSTYKVTNTSRMFNGCSNLTSIPKINTRNVTDMYGMFDCCYNLTNVSELNTTNVTDMVKMFNSCNNLSNASIQNIVNMCINSKVPSAYKNLNPESESSPLISTKFDSSYYSNRLSDLTAAGWSY